MAKENNSKIRQKVIIAGFIVLGIIAFRAAVLTLAGGDLFGLVVGALLILLSLPRGIIKERYATGIV